jgi:hypothetical protein
VNEVKRGLLGFQDPKDKEVNHPFREARAPQRDCDSIRMPYSNRRQPVRASFSLDQLVAERWSLYRISIASPTTRTGMAGCFDVQFLGELPE